MVLAIDRVPERLDIASNQGRAEPLYFEEVNVREALMEITGGRGPDRCIDAMGQTHVKRSLSPLLKKIEDGQIDPSFVVTHRLRLKEAPAAYKTFRDKKNGHIKVVLLPPDMTRDE